MKPISPARRARELIRGWLKASRESARAETDRLVQEHNPPAATRKTKYCGNCGTSTEEKEQKYCTECGTELPEHSWGQKAKVLWMAIQKRMVIAALVPLLGMGIALSAEQGNNPTMAQYVGSVYAFAILIAVWEFMFWIIKASWRAEGLRIPLVLAIVTGWWAYGMVTLIFNDMEDPYTGETTDLGDGMLSALPWIPLEGTTRELTEEWERTGESSGKMIAIGMTIYIPIIFSSLIAFCAVPLGWLILAVGRARKTDWEELLWKMKWRLW